MLLKRRSLLKLAGLAAASVLTGTAERSGALAATGQVSFLIDTSKCTGCRLCVLACKKWNRLPAEEEKFTGPGLQPRFSAINWISIYSAEGKEKWLHNRLGCMHCRDAACVQVCPAGALAHMSLGNVTINEKKCIGCNYCVSHCPFKVVSFDKALNIAKKCTFCHDRLEMDLAPACSHVCPTGAIKFGSREEMTDLGIARIQELKRQGSQNADIYGLRELEGLGAIYVLEEGRENSLEKYGLPPEPQVNVSAKLWNFIFKPVRVLAFLGLVLALWLNKSETTSRV
jgi:formate dehydrogenase iron-sulfur subunit